VLGGGLNRLVRCDLNGSTRDEVRDGLGEVV